MRKLTTPQRLAITANSGMVATALLTGGLGAEVFQLMALGVLDMRPAAVGLALLSQVLCVPVQLYAASASLYTPNRVLLRRGHLGLCAVVLALLAAPAVASTNRQLGLVVVVVAVLVGACSMSYGWATGWQSWMQSLTTPENRGRVLGIMRFTTQAVGVLFLLLATSLATPRLTAGRFAVLAALILGYLVLALLLQRRLPDPSEQTRSSQARPARRLGSFTALWAAISRLGAVPALRRLAPTVVLVNFLGTPLVLTYLVVVVEMPVAVVGVLLAVRQVLAVASVLLWGRLLSSRPAVSVIKFGLTAYALVTGLWLIIQPGTGHRLWVMAAAGAILVATGVLFNGISLAVLTEAHGQIPESESGVAFSLLSLVESTSMYLLLGLAGVLVGAAGLPGAGGWFDPYRAFLILTAVLAVVSALRLMPARADAPAMTG